MSSLRRRGRGGEELGGEVAWVVDLGPDTAEVMLAGLCGTGGFLSPLFL